MKSVNDLLRDGLIQERNQKKLDEQARLKRIEAETHRAKWIMGLQGINAWGSEAKH